MGGQNRSFTSGQPLICSRPPGFGHSEQPRNVVWTPGAQAKLISARPRAARHFRRNRAWAFLGRVGRGCTGVEIPRSGPRTRSCFRILLSDGEARRRCVVRPVRARRRRYSELHAVSAVEPGYMAADAEEDLWPKIGTGKVQCISEGNGAAAISNQGIGRRVLRS